MFPYPRSNAESSWVSLGANLIGPFAVALRQELNPSCLGLRRIHSYHLPIEARQCQHNKYDFFVPRQRLFVVSVHPSPSSLFGGLLT
jgi:hypothetical protein